MKTDDGLANQCNLYRQIKKRLQIIPPRHPQPLLYPSSPIYDASLSNPQPSMMTTHSHSMAHATHTKKENKTKQNNEAATSSPFRSCAGETTTASRASRIGPLASGPPIWQDELSSQLPFSFASKPQGRPQLFYLLVNKGGAAGPVHISTLSRLRAENALWGGACGACGHRRKWKRKRERVERVENARNARNALFLESVAILLKQSIGLYENGGKISKVGGELYSTRLSSVDATFPIPSST